jgi:hypothetical protein
MSARVLVVVDVGGQYAAQMALVEDHDVIQTLAANPAEIRDALECAAEVFPGRLLLHHQYPLGGFGVGEQRRKTPPKASGRQRPHS